jgi:hypothetical protein
MEKTAVYEVNAIKDPINSFIFSKWQNFFALLITLLSIQVVVSFISGTLIESCPISFQGSNTYVSDENVSFISTFGDIPFTLVYLVGSTLFFVVRKFFLHMPHALQKFFWNGTIYKKKGKKHEDVLDDYNESLREFESLINANRMYIAAFSLCFLAAAVLISTISPMQGLNVVMWNDFNFFPHNWIILVTVSCCMWFMVGIFLWKLYSVVFFMRHLKLQYEFNLNPYNPDGMGGFKPLGRIWASMVLIVFPISMYYIAILLFHQFSAAAYLLWQRSIDVTIMILYTFGISLFIGYPMKNYHDIVKSEKSYILESINAKIVRLWEIVREPLLSGKNEDSIRSYEETLDYSLRFIQTVREVPSWPFTPSERVGVFLIAIIPWLMETLRHFD